MELLYIVDIEMARYNYTKVAMVHCKYYIQIELHYNYINEVSCFLYTGNIVSVEEMKHSYCRNIM